MQNREATTAVKATTILKITIIVAGVLLALLLIAEIKGVLIFLLVTVLFASALKPAIEALRKRGVSRTVAVLGIYTVILLSVTVLGLLIVPPAVAQIRSLILESPVYFDRLQARVDSLAQVFGLEPSSINVNSLLEEVNTVLPLVLAGLLKLTSSVVSFLFGAFLTLVFAYYWLAEERTITRTWFSLLPDEHHTRARCIWQQIEEHWGKWVVGEVIVSLIVGVATFLLYQFTGIPYPLVLATIAALTEFVPALGPFLGIFPALVVAFTVSPIHGIVMVGGYTLIQLIKKAVVEPRILKRSADVSSLTVLLSVLTGGALLGVAGALLAVPIASALNVLLSDILDQRNRKKAHSAGDAS